MLRCPKCGRIYQEETQRFCTYDGGRLLPASEANPFVPPQIVSFEQSKQAPQGFNFPSDEEDKSGFTPQNWNNESGLSSESNQNNIPPFPKTGTGDFRKRATGRLTKPEGFNADNFISNPPNERQSGRLISRRDIPLGHIDVNDPLRQSGRLDLGLTAETPERLIGQNVKGRYFVEQFLRQDSLGATYLAQDRFTPGKRVVVYVFMRELRPDDVSVRRFQEEKVTLSHINHPGIAGILDSGELPDRKMFIVREFVDGKSLRQLMTEIGQFDQQRTARIIRQVAQALTEAHNNRIWHRNLRPENIVVKQIESSLEQAKVVDFAISGLLASLQIAEKPENQAYQSPERVLNQPLSAESDIFSLAAIAYEMLTGRTPFKYNSTNELLDRQREGVAMKPSTLRPDLSSVADAVLQKALSYDPTQRYHQSREFGESFFGALSDNVPHAILIPPPAETPRSVPNQNPSEITPEDTMAFVPISVSKPEKPATEPSVPDFNATAMSFSANENAQIIPPEEDLANAGAISEQTQPKIAVKPNAASAAARKSSFVLPLVLIGLLGGLMAIGAVGLAAWYLLSPSSQTTVKKIEVPTPTVENTPLPAETPNETANTNPVNTSSSPESTPPNTPKPNTPTISLPDGYTPFKNDKANLNGKLADNFLGFSVGYPASWQKNPKSGIKGASNFLDIANRVADKKPIEQFLVSWYGSNGTFDADKDKFKGYVPQLKGLFSKEIPNYNQVSEGETSFNGMKAYEVKFQGETTGEDNQPVKIWGRTVFLPSGKEGTKSVLFITMLATSLSSEITGADDLGTKGELGKIVQTFQLEN